MVSKVKMDLKFFVRVAFCVALVQLVFLFLRYKDSSVWSGGRLNDDVQLQTDDIYSSAGNATLGFQSIQYINLAGMFDKQDAITMQSVVSGIEMTRFDAVGEDNLRPNGKGLPPRSSDSRLLEGEKACFRSHMAVWQKMVKENIQTMMIVEDDAMWDVNIKKIHTRIARGIHELNEKLDGKYSANPNDPYSSQSWDILIFGSCFDRTDLKEKSVIISDPDAPAGEYFGTPIEDQRVIRRLPFMACTTAYALTLQGAKRLILRAAIDMNSPIDLIMGEAIQQGMLTAVSVYPQTMPQWSYVQGIGAENLGSTIQDAEKVESDNAKEVWDTVKKNMNVWGLKDQYRHASPKMPAFEAFRNSAFPDYPNF